MHRHISCIDRLRASPQFTVRCSHATRVLGRKLFSPGTVTDSQLLTEAAVAAWICRKPAAERYTGSAINALFGVSLVWRFFFRAGYGSFCA